MVKTRPKHYRKRKKPEEHKVETLDEKGKRAKMIHIKKELNPYSKDLPFANKRIISWKNVHTESMDLNAVSIATYTVRLSDLYDAFVTGAGNTRPIGFGSICPDLYDRYEVREGNITATIYPCEIAETQNCAVFAMTSRVAAPAYASVREVLSQPGCLKYFLGGAWIRDGSIGTLQPVKVYRTFNVKKFLDVKDIDLTSTGASPAASVLYFHICIATIDGAAMTAVSHPFRVIFNLVQKAEMHRKVSDVIPIA